MSQELIDAARKEVRNRMGEAFEAKATDELCVSLAGSAVRAVGLESLPTVESTVVEVKRGEDLMDRAAVARESIAGAADWASAISTMRPAVSLRDAVVREARASFQQRTRSLREALSMGTPEGMAGETPPIAAVAYCWLNETILSAADTGRLGEVAADENVVRLDLPRVLRREISHTGPLVGARAFLLSNEVDGSGITVAVIDGEVELDHPAFGGRVRHMHNHTNEAFGRPDAHGTAVAGIIGSEDVEFMGVAPGVAIFSYKLFATGPALPTDFQGTLAIEKALEDGADVANCSWGAGAARDGSSREARACDNAWALGLVITKSAGNRGPQGQTLTSPADAEGVIVVGATNRDGTRVEDYSSRGPTGDTRHRPHLVAPGGDEFGDGIFSARQGGGYADRGHGTSYAAPHVAGLAALLLAQDRSLSPDQVRERLVACCRPIDGLDVDVQGAGLVAI